MKNLPHRLLLLLGFLPFICFGQLDGFRINQLGYPSGSEKIAVWVSDKPLQNFSILAADGKTVLQGIAGKQQQSPNSFLKTQQLDFSKLTKPGSYRIEANGNTSPAFEIGNHNYNALSRAAIKGFYFQRTAMALEPEFAQQWSRPAAHFDTSVYIHSSAATAARPEGFVVNSTGGWYDAGDYNKYIVNSSITMFTLLQAYQDFTAYYDTLNLNIPESKNGLADILDETIYNLRWMLTMQDADGGVYHKCTEANFSAMDMPHTINAKRYLVQKSTAATLDFAAVMAKANRVLDGKEQLLPGLADSCKTAANRAWQWALANPAIYYRQNEMNKQFAPAITTGAYGDNNISDEWFWAATEMYLMQKDKAALDTIRKNISREATVPGWNNVFTLGLISLLEKQGATESLRPQAEKAIVGLATKISNGYKASAFGNVMGLNRRDFSWGGSAVAANQGMILIKANALQGNKNFLDAAASNLHYLCGRNATGYSFVTGFGNKQVMHPHHRVSVADGIKEPVPGLLSGGPNPGMQDSCKTYVYKDPELAFTDDDCSYASNEIAINWNAPLVYLAGAIDVLLK